MEKSKKEPSAEELLRRVQKLEDDHAHLKQQISKRMLKPHHQSSNSTSLWPVNRQSQGGVPKPSPLKLTETWYLNILQSMGQAMHIYDLNGRIIFWSRASEDLYGYTPEEAYGKTPTELVVEPKDTIYSDVILERTAIGETWTGEFPVRNKRGERFMIICTNTPFHDENQRLLGGMCVSSDARPYHVMKPGLSVSVPMRNGSGLDSQQPSIASKISLLASKMKLKMKTGENYKDHEGGSDHTDDTLESEATTPKGHIAPSPFGVFCSPNTEEHLTGKLKMDSGDKTENKLGIHKILSSKAEAWMGKKGIVWPWKEREVESFDARINRFGWHRVDVIDEHEPRPQTSSCASANLDCKPLPNTNLDRDKIEALGLWSSSLRGNITSSNTNLKSNVVIKVERETDGQDYKISWEDLIVREQIGQGSCGTVYHAMWCGSDVAVKVFAHQEYSDKVMLSFKKEGTFQSKHHVNHVRYLS